MTDLSSIQRAAEAQGLGYAFWGLLETRFWGWRTLTRSDSFHGG
jgi:hypothetical protein